ncbi:MAG TPA: hypothetical protein VE111_04655 [Bradyrhizobium sp.]|nr:hypothetical protein [Bradyrhizobium sp.]
MADILDELSALPASAIVHASREIGYAARLGWYKRSETPKRGLVQELMKEKPAFAWLFLFHPDGHVREAALNAINTPPASPFFFAALAWRLNDWAPQVRWAAARCITRVLHRATTEIAADAAIYLLDRRLAWGRWRDEVEILDRLFARSDVIAALALHLHEQATGPLASRLRHALRHASIDVHLLHLATSARQPSVRAIAYQCLISGKAAWIVGFERIWIDKVFNKKRYVPRLETREIRRPRPVADLIRQAASDKSASVRKIAADGLIAVRSELENADELIAAFVGDPSPAVRSRADYLLRHPA